MCNDHIAKPNAEKVSHKCGGCEYPLLRKELKWLGMGNHPGNAVDEDIFGQIHYV